MTNRVKMLQEKGLITPPKWLPDNTHYNAWTGSVSYGVSTDTSDFDIVGFCIPPKEDVFPHLAGEIPGFGLQKQNFGVYQQHHVKDGDREYDLTIYSIVKFFHLCMENNPNMLDSLFVPQRCVLHCTRIAQKVRAARHMFLHKGCFSKFRGYSLAQLHKIDKGSNRSNPKRQESINKFGYDIKFAYHVLRLALQCEQILEEGDLDLEKNREILKSVRRGEWTIEQIREWFSAKEKHLDVLKQRSKLRERPDELAIRDLLLECLEEHYGSLDTVIQKNQTTDQLVTELRAVLDRYF